MGRGGGAVGGWLGWAANLRSVPIAPVIFLRKRLIGMRTSIVQLTAAGA